MKKPSMIYKKVIVRANGAGVFFGTLTEKNGDEATLSNVRKIYSWEGACAVEQIANEGIKNIKDSKLTVTVSEICIQNILQLLPCTDKAIVNLESIPEWKIK